MRPRLRLRTIQAAAPLRLHPRPRLRKAASNGRIAAGVVAVVAHVRLLSPRTARHRKTKLLPKAGLALPSRPRTTLPPDPTRCVCGIAAVAGASRQAPRPPLPEPKLLPHPALKPLLRPAKRRPPARHGSAPMVSPCRPARRGSGPTASPCRHVRDADGDAGRRN
jgi:hypothetical protein